MFRSYSFLLSFEARIIATVSLIIGLILLRMVIHGIIARRTKDIYRRIVNRQISNYIVTLAGIAVIIPLWIDWFQSVFAVISVIAVAIVILTREMLVNILAHAVIVWRALFSVGDRVQIQDYIGDVVQIGPMYITLAEIGQKENDGDPTGRIIKLPNSLVLTNPIANFTRGLAVIWSEIRVEIEIGSDWKTARSILDQIGRKYSVQLSDADYESIMVSVEEALFTTSQPSTSVSVEDGKIVLRLRYSCRIDGRRESEARIWNDILERFSAESGIRLISA